jgi:transposase
MWERIEPLMPADPVRGRRWADHRRTLEAIAWKYRTCSPWRDLPDELGSFLTVHRRLIRWAVDGTWERILAAALAAAEGADDIGWTVSVDSTVCRAHQHAAGAREKGAPDRAEPDDHALGRSRGGLSAKVHLASDGHARPLALRVTAGQAGDAPAFETVMASIGVPRSGPGRPRTRPDAVLADRAYSSRAIRSHLRRRGIRAVISSRPTRSATVCGEAAPEADRPPSMPRRTSSATQSNAASAGSSDGAAWPCERASSPSPTRPHSTLPPSS